MKNQFKPKILKQPLIDLKFKSYELMINLK